MTPILRWSVRDERAARYMAPEELTAASLHHPFVGIPALRVQAGDDALARALELVVRRVEHLEGLPNELVLVRAEHREYLLVAIDHQPVARQHEADGRQVEGSAVVHGSGSRLGNFT